MPHTRVAAVLLAVAGAVASCKRGQPWAPEGEGWAVMFPRAPETRVERADGTGGAAVKEAWVTQGGVTFRARASTLAPADATREPREVLLEQQRRARSDPDAVLMEETERAFAGRPSLDFRIKTGGEVESWRLVLDGSRLLALSVEGPSLANVVAADRAFLDSLRLPERPTPQVQRQPSLVDTTPPPEAPVGSDPLATCTGTMRDEETADHLGMARVCVNAAGLRHGPYAARYSNGKPKEAGAHDHGNRDGLWTQWRADGSTALQTTYSQGVKQGRETAFDTHGERSLEGEYRNGKKEGVWRRYGERGTCVLESTYVADLKEGRETERYADGSTMKEGACKGGKRDGRWTYYQRNGRVAAQGMFRADQESGIWKQWDEEGRRKNSLEYKNGEAVVVEDLPVCPSNAIRVDHDVHQGSEQYCERTLRQRYGPPMQVRHGPYVLFDANGDVVEQGRYVEGRRDGKWTRQAGNQVLEEVYRNGQVTSSVRR
jgi:antitoxin component YwqK of YwqJK toxin-antitoxin module